MLNSQQTRHCRLTFSPCFYLASRAFALHKCFERKCWAHLLCFPLLEILVPHLGTALEVPNCGFYLPFTELFSSVKFLRTFLAFLLLTAVLCLGTLHMPWGKERGECWLISLWSPRWDLDSSHTILLQKLSHHFKQIYFWILIVFSTSSSYKCWPAARYSI